MNYKLYYAIEGILADLSWLICHNDTLSPVITDFYHNLKTMHDNSEFDYYIKQYNLTPEELVKELNYEFHDNLNIYFEDLAKEFNETHSK